MSEVQTAKAVNVEQLAAQAGTTNLSARRVERPSGTITFVTSETLSQAQLEAAVASYVYDPLWSNDAKIRDQADKALVDLRTIRDSSGNLSSAQLSNAVRLMARVLIVLVRLSLSRFDGVD